MWLGMGCSDGKATKQRDLPPVCEGGRSQSPHNTDAIRSIRIVRRPGSISRSEGRWAGMGPQKKWGVTGSRRRLAPEPHFFWVPMVDTR